MMVPTNSLSMKPQKALFLDRDGIINIDHGYTYKIEDFEFIEGIFDLIKIFMHHGYLIFIITNQSGIARGYYALKDFEILTQWMLLQFNKQKIKIQSIEHCPHVAEDACHCRKPNTGMIDNILANYHIDLHHSWLIGDKQSDIDLAINSHIPHTIAISTTSKNILNSQYSFHSILSCKEFIERNTDDLFL